MDASTPRLASPSRRPEAVRGGGRREPVSGKLSDEQLAAPDTVSLTDSLADRRAMGTTSARTNRSDPSAKTARHILRQRRAAELLLEAFGRRTGPRGDVDAERRGQGAAAVSRPSVSDDGNGHDRDDPRRRALPRREPRGLRGDGREDEGLTPLGRRLADGAPRTSRLPLYENLGMDPYVLMLPEMD